MSNGFRPFALHLSDGRRFIVPARDFIAMQKGRVAVFDDKRVCHIISALHIVSIDDSVEPRT